VSLAYFVMIAIDAVNAVIPIALIVAEVVALIVAEVVAEVVAKVAFA
jgi:hypothetical protein